jgi:hypothetical protein
MSTFGFTNAIPTIWVNGNWSNYIGVTRAQLTVNGTISKLSIQFRNQATGHAACNVKGVIYTNVSTAPSALKGVTNAVAIADSQAAGYVDLTFAANVSLLSGYYWIGFMADANAIGLEIGSTDSVSDYEGYIANTYTNGAPDPYGTGTVNIGAHYDVNATYLGPSWLKRNYWWNGLNEAVPY